MTPFSFVLAWHFIYLSAGCFINPLAVLRIMDYLSKGKRGMVYLLEEGGKTLVVKKKREGSTALRALENEAYWLPLMNRHKIGPRFHRFDDGGLVMEYVEGPPFVEWRVGRSLSEQKKMIRKIFQQCRTMDRLHVNKLEMTHQVKHILIRRGEPVMIDFERCKRTLTPKNVTQFCQFLLTLGYKVDREKLRDLLQWYKKDYAEGTFAGIVSLFC